MIPCPVCLMVVDGYGGKCRTHESWSTWIVWFPGVWPTLDDLVDQAGGRELVRGDALADLIAHNRAGLTEITRARIAADLRANGARSYGRGVFVGFRHFADDFERPREDYARAVDGLVLPLLERLGILRRDRVEGIGHLFYEITPGERPGPETPAERGVQLLIFAPEGA